MGWMIGPANLPVFGLCVRDGPLTWTAVAGALIGRIQIICDANEREQGIGAGEG
jgi:hypothetical protein